MYKINHPKADVERIYISRKEGGRGTTQIECTYRTSTIGLEKYLSESNEKLLKQVYQHQKYKKIIFNREGSSEVQKRDSNGRC